MPRSRNDTWTETGTNAETSEGHVIESSGKSCWTSTLTVFVSGRFRRLKQDVSLSDHTLVLPGVWRVYLLGASGRDVTVKLPPGITLLRAAGTGPLN